MPQPVITWKAGRGRVMPLADVIARDLADMGGTAGDIALALKRVRCALGNAYEDGSDVPADVLPDLRQAQAELAALIVEIEGAA